MEKNQNSPINLERDIEILRDLSTSEYQFIQNILDNDNKRGYDRIFSKMRKNFKDLKQYSDIQLKQMYEQTKDAPWNLYKDVREYFEYTKNIVEIKKYLKSPLTYLNNNGFPLYKSKCNKQWSKCETERLKQLAYRFKGHFNFAFCSLCFPGRSGKQINAKYHQLVTKGEIMIVDTGTKDSGPNNKFSSHLFDEDEIEIANEICQDVSNGIQIDREYISKKAECYYYEPWNVAKKAAIQSFEEKKKQIYEDESNSIYTQEFLDYAQSIQNIIDDLNDIKKTLAQKSEIDPNEKYAAAKEVLRKYKVPKATFSYSWLKGFMKRHRLSWRQAHYARRCAIDEEYVSIYLDIVADAVCKYGWEYVFNMDETSVRINNGSTKTIAPIGLDDIVIEGKRNEKECFTAIGTSTIYELKDLILLTKGTEKSCAKFNGEDGKQRKSKKKSDIEVWPTNNDNGWVNEEVVLKYLHHLHDNWSHGQPCALIMDCYKAHHTGKVIRLAGNLNIELIFVPANGTSIFQPLDRRVFGILKSKMRSFAKSNIYSGKDRFYKITEHLKRAWKEVPVESLKSAWDIPGLKERIDKLSSGPKEEDHEDVQEPNPIISQYFNRNGINLEDEIFDAYFKEEEENTDILFEDLSEGEDDEDDED